MQKYMVAFRQHGHGTVTMNNHCKGRLLCRHRENCGVCDFMQAFTHPEINRLLAFFMYNYFQFS